VASIYHLAMRTADYLRFAWFYRHTFGATCPPECANPSVVRIGGVVFHVFEVDRLDADGGAAHVGHYAIEVDGVGTFAKVREQLLALSSTEGSASISAST
jgi:hypothetical protein